MSAQQPIDVARVEPATNCHQLAERISLLMTAAGATLTESQQNVLAVALRVLEVEVPR